MKRTILLSFICMALSSNAQEYVDLTNIQDPNKFYSGWTYTPEFSYRFLREGLDANENTAETIDFRNLTEKGQFGQSASIFGGIRLKGRFFFEGGLRYSSFGEAEKPKSIASPIAEPGYPQIIGYDYRYHRLHLISVPLNFRVNFGGKRITSFVSIGVSPALLMRYVETKRYEYDSGKTTVSHTYYKDQTGFSTFHLITQLTSGIELKVSEKAKLRIAPRFQMTTNSVYAPKEIRGNYYNLGIEVGSVYKLDFTSRSQQGQK